MRLTPEGCAAVIRRVGIDALAETVEEQLGITELSDESFDKLQDGVHDALTEVLVRIDFIPEA